MLCIGKTAQRATIYHEERCDAIIKAFSRQMVVDGKSRVGEVGILTGEATMHNGDKLSREFIGIHDTRRRQQRQRRSA